jgi:hypothetical protein
MNEAPKHTPGLAVIDAKYVHGELSFLWVTASGYADDEASVNDAKALFNIYAAAEEMLEGLKIMTQCNVEWEEQRSLNDPLPNEIRHALAIIAKAEGRAEG